MVINHNESAAFSMRELSWIHNKVDKSIKQLSTGKKINYAKDNPADFYVSEKMNTQIRGLGVAKQNINVGLSLIQTAEGWTMQINESLQKLRESAIKAANDFYTENDRKQMSYELSQTLEEIDSINQRASFNMMKIFGNGNTGGEIPQEGRKNTAEGEKTVLIHSGANMNENMRIQLPTINSTVLGLKNGENPAISYDTTDQANQSIEVIDKAIEKVSSMLSKLGSYAVRLENTEKSVDRAKENLSYANSNIVDLDYSEELLKYTKYSTLMQVNSNMLAHANIQSNLVFNILNKL